MFLLQTSWLAAELDNLVGCWNLFSWISDVLLKFCETLCLFTARKYFTHHMVEGLHTLCEPMALTDMHNSMSTTWTLTFIKLNAKLSGLTLSFPGHLYYLVYLVYFYPALLPRSLEWCFSPTVLSLQPYEVGWDKT